MVTIHPQHCLSLIQWFMNHSDIHLCYYEHTTEAHHDHRWTSKHITGINILRINHPSLIIHGKNRQTYREIRREGRVTWTIYTQQRERTAAYVLVSLPYCRLCMQSIVFHSFIQLPSLSSILLSQYYTSTVYSIFRLGYYCITLLAVHTSSRLDTWSLRVVIFLYHNTGREFGYSLSAIT